MNDQSHLPPNLRPFRILEVLGDAGQALTPTEIAGALDLPKQTVHRLCNTLEANGLLSRSADGKRLRPGRRTRRMAATILSHAHAHIARHQILLDVARTVRETVNFVVPQDKGMFYVDRVETDWPFRVLLPIGTHVPFHCTASGKTFMAWLRAEARKRMVHSLSLDRLTENTITEPAALLAELKKIRARGYAIDDQEFVADMAAIAVPVMDESDRFVAALAVHGPVQRFDARVAASRRDLLLDAAHRLRDALLA